MAGAITDKRKTEKIGINQRSRKNKTEKRTKETSAEKMMSPMLQNLEERYHRETNKSNVDSSDASDTEHLVPAKKGRNGKMTNTNTHKSHNVSQMTKPRSLRVKNMEIKNKAKYSMGLQESAQEPSSSESNSESDSEDTIKLRTEK